MRYNYLLFLGGNFTLDQQCLLSSFLSIERDEIITKKVHKMKKALTLIITSLITVFLMGQTIGNSIHDHKSVRERNGVNDNENNRNKYRGIEKYQKLNNNTKLPQFPKSCKVIKHRLDSTITEYYDTANIQWSSIFKREYTYDTNENNIRIESYHIDNSKWIGEYKLDYFYDANNNFIGMEQYSWNDTSGQWIGEHKREYTLDINGNITVWLRLIWDDNLSQWINKTKTEYTYNVNEDITYKVYYKWDTTSTQWKDSNIEEYTYDNNNLLINIFYQYWSNNLNQWVDYQNHDLSYDTNNYLILLHVTWWDISSSQWINFWKEEYTYDTNGNIINIVNIEWDLFSNQWENNEKEELSYNSNNQITQSIVIDWDDLFNQWVNFKKEDYNYDVNGNPIQDYFSDWDDISNQWKDDERLDFTYDQNYDISDLIIPDKGVFWAINLEYITNMPLGYIRYGYNNTNPYMIWRITHFYSEQNVGLDEIIDKQEIEVFPNPASEIISINVRDGSQQLTFSLIDLQGRIVLQREIRNSTNISITNLPKGVYLYKIIDKFDALQSGKLIKQ